MIEGIRLGKANPLDRWTIGDLCIDAIPPGTSRAERAANQRRLAEFAAATDLPMGLLKDCYRTSRAWKPGSRISDVSHSKHSTVASKRNRVDLLLNDDMPDGLPGPLRSKVKKIEELLEDSKVRAAVVERSRTRSRRIQAAARVIEDEELVKAKTKRRIREQDAKARRAAPEILARAEDSAIKANLMLAKMLAELLDLNTMIDGMPAQYHDRAVESLTQITRASQRVLDKLRPATRAPQPCTVIDMDVDHISGAEHR